MDGLIGALFITIIIYGCFPLLFAELYKKRISRKKYRRLCFGINFLVMLVFLVLRSFTGINGSTTGGPYLIWTPIMISLGAKRLKDRALLDEQDENSDDDSEQDEPGAIKNPDTCVEIEAPNTRTATKVIKTGIADSNSKELSIPQVKFCRICGKPLPAGSKFCTECGTEVIASFPKEPETITLESIPVRSSPEKAIREPIPLVLPTEEMDATLRRAFLFLEDAEWEKADSYFERVLDAEPENAYAYLGKTMLDRKAETLEQLADRLADGERGKNYTKAERFAGPKLKQLLAALESYEGSKGESV
ncbi:MAG: zinc-ribbon domain-containing protein [Oscillospiraceae bacterium]|nr:zinc-ribbon domain-containing protein [Oscillospiraceae bacterium]